MRSSSTKRKRAACAAFLASACLGLAAVAVAIPAEDSDSSAAIEKVPGWADLSLTGILGQEDLKVDLTLEGEFLQSLAGLAGDHDAEARNLLAKLRQVRIRTFDLTEARAARVHERIQDITSRLVDRGWQPLVRARKDGKETYVYLDWAGPVIRGIVVMNLDAKDQAAFVNIVGEIDPAQVQHLGNSLHCDALPDLGAQLGALQLGTFTGKAGAAPEGGRKPADKK